MKTMNYIEMSLTMFVQLHPEILDDLPMDTFIDPRYIVRIQPDRGVMEVGFADDPWMIR